MSCISNTFGRFKAVAIFFVVVFVFRITSFFCLCCLPKSHETVGETAIKNFHQNWREKIENKKLNWKRGTFAKRRYEMRKKRTRMKCNAISNKLSYTELELNKVQAANGNVDARCCEFTKLRYTACKRLRFVFEIRLESWILVRLTEWCVFCAIVWDEPGATKNHFTTTDWLRINFHFE